MTGERKVYAGIDWAHEKHQVCLVGEEGEILEEREVRHDAEQLAKLCDDLFARVGGRTEDLAVAIETTHGIVVETLLERGIPVWSINPKQLDRFRDRFSMSGAKDDRRDARVLADSLRTDPRAFRRLEPEDPKILELREWSRMGDDLQQERIRLVNRLREQLRRYFPQMLEAAPDFGARWTLELWKLVPTPKRAARVVPSRIQALLDRHRIRRTDAKALVAILRKPAMTVAPGTEIAATAHIELVAERLRIVNEQLERCRARLKTLLDDMESTDPERTGEQRDVTIALSMPGIGPIVLATLLAEAGRPLAARDYQALRALSGVAPVTKRSGRRSRVVRRHGHHPRLANALYHWARVASQRDPATRARYAALRARGHTHGRALRSVADGLLRILVAMLRDQKLFQPRILAA